jgi:heme/copper-type cytochrome/quinol oxidase subunit 3
MLTFTPNMPRSKPSRTCESSAFTSSGLLDSTFRGLVGVHLIHVTSGIYF